MTPLEIFIPGNPVGKGRPRFGKGNVYTPSPTKAKEREVATLAKIAMIGRKPFTGAVKVQVKAWMPGSRTARPDCDNVWKLYTDALNGIVYGDDSQIVEMQMTKFSGGTPQVVVTVEAA